MKKKLKNLKLPYIKSLAKIKKFVRIEDKNVPLPQKLIVEFFDVDVRTFNEHLKNIFTERKPDENSVIRNFRITASEKII